MRKPYARCRRWGSLLLPCLLLFDVIGCAAGHYSRGQAPLYGIPKQTAELPSLGVSCGISAFDSEHLDRVDVAANFDAVYDCRSFGAALRDELAKELQKTGRFTQVSISEATGDIYVRGRVDSITATKTLTSNMGLIGLRPSATGTVTYEVGVRDSGKDPVIRDSVHAEVIHPQWGADFRLAIDALRVQLADDLAKRIAEAPELPKMAALARAKKGMVNEVAPAPPTNISVGPEPAVPRESVVPGPVDTGYNRWAVVVGVSKYAFAGQGGLDALPFAADDARMFARWLTGAGWSSDHVRVLIDEDAAERNIRVALESWLTKAGSKDLVVLYWAGHGFTDPEDPERVYFACYDTDIRVPPTGFRMDRVIGSLKERQAKNVVVLADTCHAGKLITRGERGLSVVPAVRRMHDQGRVPKGWVFMVSADTDRQAVEHSSWRNGAFTHCVLQGLEGAADGFQSAGAKDGTITLGELRAYLERAMPDETQKVLGVAKHPLITTSSGDPTIWNLTLQVK
ncbi:MAG: caspase family protein [Deltaproteobacteria bacterium]|nr:caspase family protein [Deltaproteobacteria bacterium]